MPNALSKWKKDFPKVGLIVAGNKRFYPLNAAIAFWNCGAIKVESASNEVLEENFTVRKMTDVENDEFQRRTDEYSANK